MLLQEGANPVQSLDAAPLQKLSVPDRFSFLRKKYLEKMRTRGSGRTEMEPVEVFARIKTVSNTEVSDIILQ